MDSLEKLVRGYQAWTVQRNWKGAITYGQSRKTGKKQSSMDSLEKLVRDNQVWTVQRIRLEAITYGQSRATGNIGHTGRRQTKQKTQRRKLKR